MKNALSLAALAAATVSLGASLAIAAPAAAKTGDPVKVSDDLTIDPIVEGRLRYEHVDQDGLKLDADAVTMRLRAGAEFKLHNLSLLVEGEGTLAIDDSYNAFPFAVPGSGQSHPGVHSVIPDPENIDLNRIQLSYKVKGNGVTIGRQRINLDDQRWVGSVAWRQNEQTFDAVRGEAKFGPVALDATYSWSQRTIFGEDAGPRQAYDGNFYFVGAGTALGPVNLKGFAYYLNYDDPLQIANSSKTIGLRATTTLPLSKALKLDLAGSYAKQDDWKNPVKNYSADYAAGEAGLSYKALRVAGGYEVLGSDNGFSLQTPLATLHKFNGWADVFLTTPATGLQDAYGSVAYKFGDLGAVKGVNAQVIYHQFDSDVGGIEFGTEWDAQIGFKVDQFSILAKYANYNAVTPAAGDVEKFWLQLEFAY
ncbi:Alginate export [Novosphingobium sp. CF614]|uniref:alginate export family protein n=1 Tax=Novosphingobium sp. CF614 TaxID=1884364 RepID=UPI0008EAFE2E|nr:alginate export family protein [Novosphingobium sp. CF614]SFF86657.1 Alginate export [Novosphingobium sp. CF614]